MKMIENRLRKIFHLGDYRRFLLQKLSKGSVGCELGVWKGDFSEEILNMVKPTRLYLVDPWLYQPEFPGSWYGGGVARNQKDMDDIFEAVKNKFSNCSGVEIIRKKTKELAGEISDDSLDWVYIDGNHQYEFVLNDLKTFFPKVKTEGVLCGDDYNRGKGKSITQAVHQFLKESSCELLWVKRHQFFLRKK